MALVVPNIGDVEMLNRLLKATAGGTSLSPAADCNQVVRLYGNNPTINKLTVYGDLTPSSEAGYAEVTLSPANWTIATVSSTTTATYNTPATFTFSTSATVRGYYVVDAATPTPNLLWAEEFSGGPFILPSSGGQIQVTPTLTAN